MCFSATEADIFSTSSSLPSASQSRYAACVCLSTVFWLALAVRLHYNLPSAERGQGPAFGPALSTPTEAPMITAPESLADRPAARLASLRLHLTLEAGRWTDAELEAACEHLGTLLRARDAAKDYSGQFRLAAKCDGLARLLGLACKSINGY